LRILAFCYEFKPVGGGAGNALYHLAQEWVSLGHEVTVVTSRFKDLPSTEVLRGTHVIRLSVGRKWLFRARITEMIRYMFKSVAMSNDLARRFKPDLCVAFMTLPGGLAPLWLGHRFGIPFVTELRGGDVPGFDPRELAFYHFWLRGLIHLIWKKSRAIIANSRGLALLARQSQKGVQVHVIPNGVDTESFKPPDSKPKSQKFKLLFVGRLADSQKNISMMLRCLTRIPDADLRIVGDGPDSDKLRRLAVKLNLRHRVWFEGWVQGHKLIRIYQESDAYVSASRDEGMPNTVLEALSCGLPLILSNIAGHNEIVCDHQNGYLFDVNNESDLAAKIRSPIV